ncbi:hypothetical protein [Streptomyces sp. ISID311]|uniref:DUF6881 domain-containing protein n=1 Tax=Streptomyces sp. ISID311 TaxID=2601673 RepID=UPI00164A3B68|nr:hypothetical protein [Streptomyces sp. ISID311]
MKYWKITWHHDFREEPVTLFSEIGEDGYETRKIQEYRDGRLLRTDGADETAEIGLSEIPVGRIEDVAARPEFSAFVISKADFESLWNCASRGTYGHRLASTSGQSPTRILGTVESPQLQQMTAAPSDTDTSTSPR